MPAQGAPEDRNSPRARLGGLRRFRLGSPRFHEPEDHPDVADSLLGHGIGSPARKYQSFPRWVRMPGVNTTLVWSLLPRGVFTTVER